MNNRNDLYTESLNILIEKAIYDLYQDQQPGLVAVIRELRNRGQFPSQIEQSINKLIPVGSQVGHHAYLVASYLMRRQCSQN